MDGHRLKQWRWAVCHISVCCLLVSLGEVCEAPGLSQWDMLLHTSAGNTAPYHMPWSMCRNCLWDTQTTLGVMSLSSHGKFIDYLLLLLCVYPIGRSSVGTSRATPCLLAADLSSNFLWHQFSPSSRPVLYPNHFHEASVFGDAPVPVILCMHDGVVFDDSCESGSDVCPDGEPVCMAPPLLSAAGIMWAGHVVFTGDLSSTDDGWRHVTCCFLSSSKGTAGAPHVEGKRKQRWNVDGLLTQHLNPVVSMFNFKSVLCGSWICSISRFTDLLNNVQDAPHPNQTSPAA